MFQENRTIKIIGLVLYSMIITISLKFIGAVPVYRNTDISLKNALLYSFTGKTIYLEELEEYFKENEKKEMAD